MSNRTLRKLLRILPIVSVILSLTFLSVDQAHAFEQNSDPSSSNNGCENTIDNSVCDGGILGSDEAPCSRNDSSENETALVTTIDNCTGTVFFGICDNGLEVQDDTFELKINDSIVASNQVSSGIERATIGNTSLDGPAELSVTVTQDNETPPGTFLIVTSKNENTVRSGMRNACQSGDEEFETETVGICDTQGLTLNLDCIIERQGIDPALTSIGGILGKATPILFTFAGLILLIMLVAGGFAYLTSGGDPKKLETAKGRITYSLVGFIIVIVAFWLVQIAAFVFNLTEVGRFFG